MNYLLVLSVLVIPIVAGYSRIQVYEIPLPVFVDSSSKEGRSANDINLVDVPARPEPTSELTFESTEVACSRFYCDRNKVYRNGCEDGWLTLGKKCLKVNFVQDNYANAFNFCRDQYHANMLSIQSEEEQTLLMEKLIKDLPKESSESWIYIGAERCPHTGFNWVASNGTKTPIEFKNWEIGQPQSTAGYGSEACVGIKQKDGKWHDIGCDLKTISICEKIVIDEVLLKLIN